MGIVYFLVVYREETAPAAHGQRPDVGDRLAGPPGDGLPREHDRLVSSPARNEEPAARVVERGSEHGAAPGGLYRVKLGKVAVAPPPVAPPGPGVDPPPPDVHPGEA